MIKLLILIVKKPGISRTDFIAHYETVHAPLIEKNLGHFFLDYTRSFVCEDGRLGGAGEFDVLTEIRLKDRAALDAMFAAAGEPRLAAEIAADEETFIDRTRVQMFVADVYP